jgi:bifunctional DNA-binding transcriptional regulator/antitoxin component of YhaV-PrlF toxin-antitoxin module
VTRPEPDATLSHEGERTAAQNIVAALGLPALSEAPSEPFRPLPFLDLHRLSRDTTVLYDVGRVDASGRVTNTDLIRALGWQVGDKLEVVTALGGIIILASPDGLFSVPRKPRLVIPAAARRQHDIGPGDHVLLAAAPEFGLVIIHTRQAMNEMLARYHSTFTPPDRHQHE